MKNQPSGYVSTRLPVTVQAAFLKKVKREFNTTTSTVMRELIIAFVEDRITVKPVTKEFLEK